MGSSVYTPEIASRYGALDSDVILDGGPASAQALRQLVMSTHRLLGMGGPLLNLMFDASDDDGGSESLDARGVLTGYAWPNTWRKLYPGPLVVPKKSTHRRGECQIVAKVSDDDTLYIQVATNGARFNNDATTHSPNMMVLQGTGDWETYDIADNDTYPELLLGPWGIESLELWIKGAILSADLVSEVVYGAHNAGTSDLLWSDPSVIYDGSSDWNAGTGNASDGSVYLVWINPNQAGELLAAPRIVTRVWDDGTHLQFAPPLSPTEARLVRGVSYELRHLADYRIGSVSIYTSDLTGMGG